MTPFAGKLAKQLVLPEKRRDEFWRGGNTRRLRDSLDDIHCFEVTAAIPMVEEFRSRFAAMSESEADSVFAKMAFLPAPKTWLEYYHGGVGRRLALLLKDNGSGWASVNIFMDGRESGAAGTLGFISLTDGTWDCPGVSISTPDEFKPLVVNGKSWWNFLGLAHYLLAIINTPRIIGRRQHMPLGSLERRLTKKMGAGKFPLHAWTEIKLEINKSVEIDDGEEHEAHLTGRRALHFCRAHLRIRNGQLEYVTSHWRGDPAIGIKQSRYKLVS